MTYELQCTSYMIYNDDLRVGNCQTTQCKPISRFMNGNQDNFCFENWRALSNRYSDRVKTFNMVKGCHKLAIKETRFKLAKRYID